jgi:hypothetical protein
MGTVIEPIGRDYGNVINMMDKDTWGGRVKKGILYRLDNGRRENGMA